MVNRIIHTEQPYKGDLSKMGNCTSVSQPTAAELQEAANNARLGELAVTVDELAGKVDELFAGMVERKEKAVKVKPAPPAKPAVPEGVLTRLKAKTATMSAAAAAAAGEEPEAVVPVREESMAVRLGKNLTLETFLHYISRELVTGGRNYEDQFYSLTRSTTPEQWREHVTKVMFRGKNLGLDLDSVYKQAHRLCGGQTRN